MAEEMARDETVFLLGEDIAEFGGSYKTTVGLLEKFGRERVRNTPISEQGIVGAALGAALMGLRPVAELMYIDFSAVAMDQIVNQVAKVRYMFGGKAKTALVIRTQGGAGRSSAAQHAQSLEAWFVHVPGLKVVMPSTPRDAKGLLKSAIRDDDPVFFIEHKLLYLQKGPVPEEDYTIPLGVAEVKREGRDLTIVATSSMVGKSLQAAAELEKEGVSCEVVDPRTLFPLDKETILASVRKTGRLLITHEAVQRCGWGAEMAAIAAREAFDHLDAPIVRVCAKETPVPFAPKLESHVIPNKDDVIAGARALLETA
ncbi:MAG: alpha-ketoacid dehydrogenase subunit beta [Candidatus Tectomicrobia bacterium]|nr:alpha-ketoacid dehydrogenase subunit beta [Candidatus Tectomicrobia bacterium]MBI3025882.1 alpha-ketoacid dehydrogenase subunit beta [Candidatus Tectomicrobia bacterium]